jgi:hypothetical protein
MTSLAQKATFFDNSIEIRGSEPSYQTIVASNVRRGDGNLIATCDLKIGGIFIRGVRVRRGRAGSVFINYPSTRLGDNWVKLVEITSRPLEEAVRQVVLKAVGEATRW